jgi:hypothetical protein
MLSGNRYPLCVASEDSPFVGFDELFVSNLSAAPILGLGLTISGVGTSAIGTLAPGESWTTLVPDGSTQGTVLLNLPSGQSQTFNTVALGSSFIVGSPAPEPSTLVLLGVGAAGLLSWAWRRRWLG